MQRYPSSNRISRRRRPQRQRTLPECFTRTGCVTVVTVLDPTVRGIIDTAIAGTCNKLHVESVSEAARAVREHSPAALLVSPLIADRHSLAEIRGLVAGNPAVTTVAVLADDWPTSHGALLRLGACGIDRVVNLAERDGWNRLRDMIDRTGGEGSLLISREILRAAEGSSADVLRFFAALVRLAPETVTVRALGRALEIRPSTLMSRFFRERLPSPKTYLAMARLVFAAYFLEQPRVSVAATAYALHYSSAQSFGRHVRTTLGLTAGQFRRELTFRAALDHYLARLIEPYRDRLKTFEPLAPPVATCRMKSV